MPPPRDGERESPLVSVVVPTFNRSRYLEGALRSALAQTYANIEVIVSDDASTEDVFGTTVAKFSDPRLKYVRNPVNLGMGRNIWGAMTSAGGKYVATLHDDDEWEPGFLTALVPPLERDETLSVAFCDHAIIDADGRLNEAEADRNTRFWHRDALPAGVLRPFLELALVTRVLPAAMAAVFRKSAIDWTDFPAEVGTYYDAWITYLAARTGAGAFYDPRRLTRYRIHGQSETRSWTSSAGRLKALTQQEFVARRCVDDPALTPIRPDLVRQYRAAVVSLAVALVENGRGDDAHRLLERARPFVDPLTQTAMTLLAALPPRACRGLMGSTRRIRAALSRLRS
jgi:glycosyltransferase involved in cell wall biosynthesis